MPASEYGSYYWCVILNGTEAGQPGDSVHLHADEISIDSTGTLTFTSLGRRPVGVEPKQEENGDKKSPPASAGAGSEKQGAEKKGMIYMAFAPGTWRTVYAAKLQDGSPASVEHWNALDGQPEIACVPSDSGAAGFTHRGGGS